MTTPQTLSAFAVLALVLETARRYSDYEVVRATKTWQWGSEGPMVVTVSPGPSGQLLWGDVIETVIAVQIFLSTTPCATYVWINELVAPKGVLGHFWLKASTSSVSTS